MRAPVYNSSLQIHFNISTSMNNNGLLKSVSEKLIGAHKTISVAESVTSGLVQAAFSAADNATSFFQGGITVYNIKQKIALLHVDAAEAASCNCVSETVARQMAIGCRKMFMSDIAIGITGYASKLPEYPNAGLYACLAIVLHDQVVYSGTINGREEKTSLEMQLYYVNEIMELLTNKI
jgi:PncC family amidohydrolase